MEVDRTYTLRRLPETITRQTITRNSQGRGEEVGHGNLAETHNNKNTKEMGYTRREMEKMATDRKRWRSLVDGVCSQRAKSISK